MNRFAGIVAFGLGLATLGIGIAGKSFIYLYRKQKMQDFMQTGMKLGKTYKGGF